MSVEQDRQAGRPAQEHRDQRTGPDSGPGSSTTLPLGLSTVSDPFPLCLCQVGSDRQAAVPWPYNVSFHRADGMAVRSCEMVETPARCSPRNHESEFSREQG